ncbi:MAG TPA: MFS transporter [Gaiellaceae bacterium]|nr:MFS transporter [Gaiellaceae bacterium]
MTGSAYPVRRNTLLLSATLTCLSGTIQLVVAVATTTLVVVTGIEGILGLGPAIFLTTGALAAFPAGRLMDRHGRVPILAAGCLAGVIGTSTTGLGCLWDSAPVVIAGFAIVGVSNGTVLLARAAAADMVPPERRPRQISIVLFGAVAGAILGPFVFGPLFTGRDLDARGLVVPWLAAGGFMILALALVLSVRPDPQVIAREYAGPSAGPAPHVPIGQILRRPGVGTALVATVASFATMAAVMNLTGYVMVGHGHHQRDVFPVISAHIVGMYGLVLVVGDLIERIGRRESLVAGLGIMAVSTISLVWVAGAFAIGVALFGLGLGWSLSYVAATSTLVDLAGPTERAQLVGFGDLVAGLTAAALALLGGLAYSKQGVETLAIGATLAVVLPAIWLALGRRPREALEAA